MSDGHGHEPASGKELGLLTLSALGIVYGDIGTSPLYALRESFHGEYAMAVNHANILGVLSLMIWALIFIISIKYLLIVMRADNDGEGGILALMALVAPDPEKSNKTKMGVAVIIMGLFGSALLYGDGMITPAISVLSAIEGLKVATPVFDPYVIPITVGILIGLFLIQYRGTAGIGVMFGPIMLVWFTVLGILGISGIIQNPEVFAAFNPWHAIDFFVRNGIEGIVVLGAVFLVVTGGEALYADMGHFGSKPIRIGWFSLVVPGLLLNYLGQGALMMARPELAENPFYHLAPHWALYPLVGLAAIATVIASQAVISGVFSLTLQAVQFGYFPRVQIRHTSEAQFGQIYVPLLNWFLLIACIGLVIGFQSSSKLAAAYGVAVTLTMIITDILLWITMRKLWKWPLPVAVAVTTFFLIIDLAFFGANALKIAHGGWFPLVVGALIYMLMATWRRGRELLNKRIQAQLVTVSEFMDEIGVTGEIHAEEEVEVAEEVEAPRVPGTFVYMTSNPTGIPPALVQNFRHNRILHDKIIFLTIVTDMEARLDPEQRVEIKDLGNGFYRLIGHYGFMEEPDVPELLALASDKGLEVGLAETTFVVGRETILATEIPGMAIWREKLFAFMARNALRATAYFKIPREQVLEIGTQVKI